jgi:tetratricopeptide (TPR) repeat protein
MKRPLPNVSDTASFHGGQRPEAPAPVAPQPLCFGNGRYKVERLLGEGGQKWVYLGRDTALERDIVISVLKPSHSDNISFIRLRREAMAMAQLGAHPHVVTVYDIGEEEEKPYVITEFVDGGSISALLTSGQPLPLDQVLKIAEQVALALQYAHDAGIVHRDVKPANVWLTRDGVAKLGDFGLALLPRFSDLSREGSIIGTAHYMAPEQALGRKAQPSSDTYALGAMLYEMVTGKPPFRADQLLAIISQHINTPPVAPSWHNSDIPKALEALILDLLEKKPEKRPDARAVIERVRAIARSAAAIAEIAVQSDLKSLSRLAEGIFVGREEVASRLRKEAEEAQAGRGRLVLLSGEPGSGKTRTTEQLATYAGLRGMRVLTGRCYEGEGAPTFWPWLQIVRAYSKDLSADDLQEMMSAAAPVIAQVVPEVREKLPDIPPPPTLEPDKARFRLFDGIAAFLRSASRRQTLVLILDDLQWADHSSLLMLEFLVPELSASRLLVVGTFRDSELGRQHPLTRTLSELTRHGADCRLALEGLNKRDIAKYFELSSGIAAAESLVEAVHRRTDGNPLFVAEIVRLLVSEGRLAEVASEGDISIPIPQTVHEVIQRRLDRLPAGCDRILATASVVGRCFNLRVLQALHTETEDQLLELLEAAASARLIREAEGSAGDFSFAHALIRDSVYEQMSAARRARLHRRIALAIEEICQGALDDQLPALAYHFSESPQPEDWERAIHYSVLAAERATSQVAYEEAVVHHQRALDLTARQGAGEGRRTDILLELGEAQMRAGMLDRARTTLESAADLARRRNANDKFVRAVLCMVPGAIGVLYGKADTALLQLIDEALARCGSSDTAARARLLAQLSLAHYHAPKQRRLGLSEEAVGIARRLQDPSALLPALYSRSVALMGFEKAEERLEVATELVRVAEGAQAREMALRGHYGRFRELLEIGVRPALDEALESYGRLAEELRQPSLLWLYPFGRSVIALMEGRLDDALRLAQESQALGQRGRDVNARLFVYVMMVTASGLQGRSADVVDNVRNFLEEYPLIPSWRATLAKIYYDLDQPQDARREMELVGNFAEHPRDGAWVVGMALLAQVASWLGDTARARQLYELLLPFGGRNIVIGTSAVFYGPVSRHLGLLAAALSEWDTAERHFEDAMVMNSRMRALPFLAYSQLEYGAMLLRSHRSQQRARSLLEQALAAGRSLGMQKVIRDAERLLAQSW